MTTPIAFWAQELQNRQARVTRLEASLQEALTDTNHAEVEFNNAVAAEVERAQAAWKPKGTDQRLWLRAWLSAMGYPEYLSLPEVDRVYPWPLNAVAQGNHLTADLLITDPEAIKTIRDYFGVTSTVAYRQQFGRGLREPMTVNRDADVPEPDSYIVPLVIELEGTGNTRHVVDKYVKLANGDYIIPPLFDTSKVEHDVVGFRTLALVNGNMFTYGLGANTLYAQGPR